MRRTAIALSCGVLALAGCSTNGSAPPVVVDSGQAAVSSAFRVSQSEINDDVSKVLAAQGQPTGEPPAGLASATTERVVVSRLISNYATAKGLEITNTQVEEGLAQLATEQGGQDALRQAALQSGIPPEALDDFVRTRLLGAAIGLKLNPAGDATAQLASAQVALAEYSDSIDVEVSPRYGTWDDAQLSIIPGSDVSVPSAQEQATP